jgi:hypothetical protein
LEESQYQRLKQAGADSLLFYFIPPEYIDSTSEQIRANGRYTVLKLQLDAAWKKPVTHIFYYSDSTEVTHAYNAGAWRQ